jgi:hypothetical protein
MVQVNQLIFHCCFLLQDLELFEQEEQKEHTEETINDLVEDEFKAIAPP